MSPPVCSEFELGRRFVGRLPHGKDLIASIKDFCMDAAIQMATFSVAGAVSSATIGVYDQKQQVYVTFIENAPMEVLTCIGNISLKDQAPVVHAHIVLCDEHGKLIGGHLFSDTVLYAGEMDLQELVGKPMERIYDRTTGLFLWNVSP